MVVLEGREIDLLMISCEKWKHITYIITLFKSNLLNNNNYAFRNLLPKL